MQKTYSLLLIICLVLSGCVASQELQKPVSQRPAYEVDFPGTEYMTAIGIGQSEAEARKLAIGELSNIFESKVVSETTTNAKAIFDSKNGDSVERSIESDIRISSSVDLKGVRVEKTWKESGEHYALAVLNKQMAFDNWSGDIKKLDTEIDAELGSAKTAKSMFLKLKPLKNVVKFWVKREVTKSRIRVMGYKNVRYAQYDMKAVFTQIADIKSEMVIHVKLNGEYSREVSDTIAETLNEAGFKITQNKRNADVLISGNVVIKPVNLKNPNWKFARAQVSININDSVTNNQVGEIAEDNRKGHISYNEAAHKAVKKVTETVSEKLINYF